MAKSKYHLSFRFWLLCLIVLIILLITYFVIADRITPSTDDAYAEAYVVQLSPQVAGRVTGIYVINNTHVKKGEKLFTIDPRPFRHRIHRLEAQLVTAKHVIKQLETELKITAELIKQREGDLVYAQQHYSEVQQLVEEGAVAKLREQQLTANLIERRELLRQAKSHYIKVQQKLSAMIDGKHAGVKKVMAELALEKWYLSETTVYAPFDGTIINMRLARGTYAKIGTPVVTIISEYRWWVVANIKENNLGLVRPGQHVDVSFSIYPNKTFDGEVESVGRGVNFLKKIPDQYLPHVEKTINWVRLAQRFPVRIKLVSFDVKKYPLKSGTTALVTIYTDKSGFFHAMAYWVHRMRSFYAYIG